MQSRNTSNEKSTNEFFDDMVANEPEKSNGTKPHSKSKKRKKKSKEGLQKKKERKLHDVEGQFEGLPMPDFSGIALTNNMNFEASEKGNESEKSKKKSKKKNSKKLKS